MSISDKNCGDPRGIKETPSCQTNLLVVVKLDYQISTSNRRQGKRPATSTCRSPNVQTVRVRTEQAEVLLTEGRDHANARQSGRRPSSAVEDASEFQYRFI